MDNISLQGKTNFFERRVSEYSRAGFSGEKDAENDEATFSVSRFVVLILQDWRYSSLLILPVLLVKTFDL